MDIAEITRFILAAGGLISGGIILHKVIDAISRFMSDRQNTADRVAANAMLKLSALSEQLRADQLYVRERMTDLEHRYTELEARYHQLQSAYHDLRTENRQLLTENAELNTRLNELRDSFDILRERARVLESKSPQ